MSVYHRTLSVGPKVVVRALDHDTNTSLLHSAVAFPSISQSPYTSQAVIQRLIRSVTKSLTNMCSNHHLTLVNTAILTDKHAV